MSSVQVMVRVRSSSLAVASADLCGMQLWLHPPAGLVCSFLSLPRAGKWEIYLSCQSELPQVAAEGQTWQDSCQFCCAHRVLIIINESY